MSRLVAVTGATGFIGKALCRRLVADGYSVRALVRNPGKADGDLAGTELYRGDITNPENLRGFVAGAQAVVHCAGNVRGSRQEDFDSVNVDGIRHLLDAIKQASPAPRLLNLSSLAAREPDLSFYATSKFRGEQYLVENAGTIKWASLRPPPVYGPGDKELLPLLQLMARGFALIPSKADARFSMIYVDDLVGIIAAWLQNPTATNGVFTLEDGTPNGYDWQDITAAISEFTGRRVRRLPVPAFALDGIALINRTAARLFGYAPMLTPEKLRELRHDNWVCDSSDLHNALGWSAKTQLREGLKKTLFHDVADTAADI